VESNIPPTQKAREDVRIMFLPVRQIDTEKGETRGLRRKVQRSQTEDHSVIYFRIGENRRADKNRSISTQRSVPKLIVKCKSERGGKTVE